MAKTKNIPKDWKWVKLGDYVKSVKGKKPKRISSIKTKECSIPYVNIKAFEKNIIDEYTDGIGCVLCNDGDFVMVWDGSRSGYVGKSIKGALGSTLVKLDFPNIDNNYTYYFLQSKFMDINTRAKGVGIPHVDPNILWNYELLIPPLATQQAIVSKIEELFSELDNGIAHLKTAQQQLKTYRQSVLKWAFEGKLTEEWRKANIAGTVPNISGEPLTLNKKGTRMGLETMTLNTKVENIGFEPMTFVPGAGFEPATLKDNKKSSKSINPANQGSDNKRYAEKEGVAPPDLPEGWKLVSMGEVIEKPKYGTSKKCEYKTKGIGVLRIPNISFGIVDSSDLKFAKFETSEIETYRLQEGDILTIRSNGSVDLVGKCALITKKDTSFLYAGYLIRLRPIKNMINSKYLLNILSSIDLRNQIENKAKSTSGVNNINSEELSSLKIQLPSLDEQHQIVQEIESRLSVADKMEESITASLQQAEALRQSILKKAFEGRLLI